MFENEFSFLEILPYPKGSFKIADIRRFSIKFSTPDWPPGKTTKSKPSVLISSIDSSGNTLIPREPLIGQLHTPAIITFASERLSISTTVIVSISSKPGATGTSTFFIEIIPL